MLKEDAQVKKFRSQLQIFFAGVLLLLTAAACGQQNPVSSNLDKSAPQSKPASVFVTVTPTPTPTAGPDDNLLQEVTAAEFKILFPTEFINTTTPTAKWPKAPKAKDYDLIVSRDKECKVPLRTFGDVTAQTQPLGTLTEGTYTLCLWAIQEKGALLQAVGSPLTFTVDVTPPAAPTLESSEVLAKESTVSISFTPAAEGADFYDLVIASDATCQSPVASMPDQTQSPITIGPLLDGDYFVCLYAKDKAGNKTLATSGAVPLKVDTVSPTPPVLAPLAAYHAATSYNLTYTDGTDLNLEGHQMKFCTQNDCSLECALSAANAGSPTTVFGLAEGSSYFACVRAVDKVGNSSAWVMSSSSVTIDTTAPTPPQAVAVPAQSSTSSFTLDFTGGTDTYFSHHNVKLCSSADCTGGCAYQAEQPLISHAFTLVADGSYYGCAQSVDLAGNTSAWVASAASVLVDATAPTIPANVAFVSAYTNETSASVGWSASTDGNLSFYTVKACRTADCLTGCLDDQTTTETIHTLTDLTHGFSYYACVRATDTLGNRSRWALSAQPVIVDTLAPSAPANITLPGAYATTAAVTVTWDDGIDEHLLHHQVKMCEDGGCTLGCTPAESRTSQEATFEELEDGKSYYACVQSQDQAGNRSALIASASAIKIDLTNPTPPSGLSLPTQYATTSSIVVSWTDGSDTNFLRTNMRTCPQNDCTTACTDITPAPTSPHTLEGLNDGESFYICVASEDQSSRVSPWIASAKLIVDFTPPLPPGNIDVGISFTSGDPIFTWTEGTDANLSHALVKACEGSDCATGCSDALTVEAGTASTVVADLVDGSRYYACIKEVDAAGHDSGAFAASLATVTIDRTSPTAPSGVAVEAAYIKSSTFNVTWTSGSDLNLKVHNIKTCSDAGCSTGCVSPTLSNVTDHTATLGGLAEGTYFACVRAEDKAGNRSQWIASASQVTLDTTVPIAPKNLAFSDNYSRTTAAAISFEAGSDLYLAGYSIKACRTASCECAGEGNQDTPVATTATLSGLADGQSYYACVRSRDAAGNVSDWALSGGSITIDTTLPAAPTDLTPAAEFVATTSVSMSFTPSLAPDISHYTAVACENSNCIDGCSAAETITASPVVLGGLVNGRTYTLCMTSHDQAGNSSAWAQAASTVTVDTVAPGPFTISGPAAVNYTQTVNVSFTAAEGASSYELKVAQSADCSSPLQTFTGITATQAVSLADGLYNLCMTARDEAGNTTAAGNNGYSIEIETTDAYVSYTLYDSQSTATSLKIGRWYQKAAGAPQSVDSVAGENNIDGRSALALDSLDNLHVSYAKKAGTAYFDLYYATNASGAFAPLAAVTSPAGFQVGTVNHLALTSADQVSMVYRHHATDGSTTNNEKLAVADGAPDLSPQDLGTFSGANVAFIDTATAVNSQDVIELIYTRFTGTSFIMRHLKSENGWTAPDEAVHNDDSPCNQYLYASLAIDSQDKLHIAYVCRSSITGSCQVFYASNSGDSWVFQSLATIRGSSCDANTIKEYDRPTIALDGEDQVHIAYVNEDTATLHYATNQSGAFVDTELATGGWDNSLTVDPDGKVYIFYLNVAGGSANLKLITNNSGSWVSSVVDGSGRTSAVGSAVIKGVKGVSNR
jgi:hypothetical protein